MFGCRQHRVGGEKGMVDDVLIPETLEAWVLEIT
jgi:hypothetical protein